MLVQFKVSGFKNFKDQLDFQLDKVNNYEFNMDAIKDGVVKTALVYGENGEGKSNLSSAIFDITLHLTDKQKKLEFYTQYLNLELNQNAEFYYKFKFNDFFLEYRYQKSDAEKLLFEELMINSKQVIYFDHVKNTGHVTLGGAETLNRDLTDKNISFIKYIGNNTILHKNEENKAFDQFLHFVDNMLLISSLERNKYQGFRTGSGSVAKEIIENGKLSDFQSFLKRAGLEFHLEEREDEGEKIIACNFNGQLVNFYSIASKGTTSLTLFYFWLMQFDKLSLIVIDEFDAFYHNKLARFVVEEILQTQVQAILTTHNTSIMDNDLLRPDCYFNLVQGNVTSIAASTNKELRKAHNLEKMYRAGSFNE
ncbi:MAG TPA: ATP-binding protein [Candidatus Paenibacillus intestinavium]|nr:ATP-binding protein [Candidatus Paenibacillus intestinavium]